MDGIVEDLVPFLAILNPFALCLYTSSVMEDLDFLSVLRVAVGACTISVAVFWLFALTGQALLEDIFRVEPEALRIFGGLIFLIVGYNYVTKGYRGAEVLRGSLEELPSAIALPFMIGAGTITQAIIIGKNHTWYASMIIVFLGVLVALVTLVVFKIIRDRMAGARERLFVRYVNIVARLNGLLIGAISVKMIVEGLRGLWKVVSEQPV
jgi:small neutral amino acid transporter SnatA (MarC family)